MPLNKALIFVLLFISGLEPHPGPNHLQNRERVCAVCLLKADKVKTGYRCVNEHQEAMIKEKISAVYDRENLCLPTGLCNACRLKIERPYVCNRFPNYSKIFKNGSLKWTRERESKVDKCDCEICKVSAAKMNEYRKMKNSWLGKLQFKI